MTTLIGQLGKEAAQLGFVEKLASDTRCAPELILRFAAHVGLPPTQFVKKAYANPDDYIAFLRLALGTAKLGQVKIAAGGLAGLLSKAKGGLAGAGEGLMNAGKGVVSGEGTLLHGLGVSPGKAALGTAAIGLPLAGYGIHHAMGGGGSSETPKAEAPKSGSPVRASSGAGAQGASAAPAPGVPNGPSQAGGLGAAFAGMDPKMKLMLLLGGGALAGGGAYALARRKKKEAADDIALYKAAMERAIFNKRQQLHRKQAADTLCRYLDVIAGKMKLEKSASVRVLQTEILHGKPLSFAIKVAFPKLSGEQRGILAHELTSKAAAWKQANSNCGMPNGYQGTNVPTQTSQSWSGPMGDAGAQMHKMAMMPPMASAQSPGQGQGGMMGSLGAGGGAGLGALGGGFLGAGARKLVHVPPSNSYAGRSGGYARAMKLKGILPLLMAGGGALLGGMAGHAAQPAISSAATGSVPSQGIEGVNKALTGK